MLSIFNFMKVLFMRNFFSRLSAKQKRRLLLIGPLFISLMLIIFWPAQPCEKTMSKLDSARMLVDSLDLIAKLDSLAFGGHCDTFSLVKDKTFWVIPKCGKSSAQFRDSLKTEGTIAALEEELNRAEIGAVYYQYPSISFELNQRMRGGFDFRLVYSRNKLIQHDDFWSTCVEAKEKKLNEYRVYLSSHWYGVAQKLR